MKSKFAQSLLPFSIGAAGLLFASCAPLGEVFPIDYSNDPQLQRDLDTPVRAPLKSGYSYWDDSGASGELRVKIDLSEQTAYIHRGDVQVGRSRVATGVSGHRTPTGSFTIMEKTREKRSNLYGRILNSAGRVVTRDADARTDRVPSGGRFVGASMPYWMRLTSSGIGMHAGPIPNPGSPASHGCIRMPSFMARNLFTNAPVGTPVTIVP